MQASATSSAVAHLARPLLDASRQQPASRLQFHRNSSLNFSHRGLLRINAQGEDKDYVSYEGKQSVFPAEACEEVGGEACQAEGVGQEVKPSSSTASKPAEQPKDFPEREYEDYKQPKTVFPGEACDELGGEFCDPEYQKGVFPEKTAK